MSRLYVFKGFEQIFCSFFFCFVSLHDVVYYMFSKMLVFCDEHSTNKNVIILHTSKINWSLVWKNVQKKINY